MLDLTKKGREFKWDEHCKKSFESMKSILVSLEIMGYPLQNGGQFILDVDASDVGIGASSSSSSTRRPRKSYCICQQSTKQSRTQNYLIMNNI